VTVANRDKTQFEQAEKFVRSQILILLLQRDSLCLGAPLARLEGKLVLKAVLDRLNLQIDPIAALEFIPPAIYTESNLPVLF